MQELKTIADKISRLQASVYRKLKDLNVRTLGTKCQILRITSSLPDDWGQTLEDLKDFIIGSVFIKRPFSGKVQLFGQADVITGNDNTSAIDLMDYLPTEIFCPMHGDREGEPVSLLKNDLIVQVIRDQFDTKIPIIYQITRAYGQITVFTLCGKLYEAALYRGTLAPNIKKAIDLYCDIIE